MCWEYDEEYIQRLAEQTRRAMKEAEDRLKQARLPAAPAAEPDVKQPVPA